MEYLSIRGGRRINGHVSINGAKNAALPACVASLLTDEPIQLENVPNLRDVDTILSTVSSLGKNVERNGNSVRILAGHKLTEEADEHYVRQMRASFLVTGPLLARLGQARISLPGGCEIGRRPVNLHLQGLEALGASVEQDHNQVFVKANRLVGSKISLSYPSVGATEHLIMTATLASGRTRIENPALEPEVGNLVVLLRKMGAKIEVESDSITIWGTSKLSGARQEIIPDRMEAGTYLIAGAVTGESVTVNRVIPEHIESLLVTLEEAGVHVTRGDESVCVERVARPTSVRVTTNPYPGFPTDLHPPLAVMTCVAKGTSAIQEKVFERRFGYVPALEQMGAKLAVNGRTVTITGTDTLLPARVTAPDIRAGAALILAGLATDGETRIYGLDQIDRGYESVETKLRELGAEIVRTN